jgi:hypothetical protein
VLDVYRLTIAVDCSPQIVLRAIYLYKDFIDEEGISIASMLSFQPASINSTKLDTPKADSFSGYGDAPPSQEVFSISVAKVEAPAEPDSVTNDIEWESVVFVCVHPAILSNWVFNLAVLLSHL